MKEILLQMNQHVIEELQCVIQFAEQNDLTNTQEFLNFLDTINKLSVSY